MPDARSRRGADAAKLFALACSSILYVSAGPTVAVLTVIYLLFAILPSAHLLHAYAS